MRRSIGLGCATLLGLVVLAVIALAIIGAVAGSPASKKAAVPTIVHSTARAVTPSGHSSRPFLSLHQSGGYSSATFKAPGTWTFCWAYDCSSSPTAYNGRDNFMVDFHTSHGGYTSLEYVNELGRHGAATYHMHQGGKFYLTVDTSCRWSIVATASRT